MGFQWFFAGQTCDAWLTLTLTSLLIAYRIYRTTDVTSTVCTTEEIALLKIICTIHTLVTASVSYSRFADTLTTLRVTFTDISNNTRYIALTLFTPLRIIGLQIPIERLTLIADSTFDTILALAKLTGR